MARISETETVIKRIVPYLERRGYDRDKDLVFECPATEDTRTGFIDILVTMGRKTPAFLIEAKRDGTRIAAAHRKQAVSYGKRISCPLVFITNGQQFEALNANTGNPIRINGTSLNRVPNRDDLVSKVVPALRKDKLLSDISIPSDESLPFRPGLPLTKLNHLIKQCHNTIRNVEKNEEHAFSDFSKILFLKLLEEKWDIERSTPLYSYRFHELAETPPEHADRVKDAIESMIKTIEGSTRYGKVLADPIRLKKGLTYLKIVKQVASVSFSDCDLDTKGAAFEYFVRATLKGKKLGQYFTPRPLVRLMLAMGHYEQILNSLAANQPFKVLDPACGSGGFLVAALNASIAEIQERVKARQIHPRTAEELTRQLKEETFFGIDAHEGVASSAKMNMIIAGDGHTNIRCENSLALSKYIPPYTSSRCGRVSDGKAHLVLTNPPFGTTESESLDAASKRLYKIPSTKGQSLFIQRMIDSVHAGSRIVTVIDDGVLSTASYTEIRQLILRECRLEFVIGLPSETFKPNKINVKSSVLVLEKREKEDVDLTLDYPVGFIKLNSLGYEGSGDEVRGFDLEKLIQEVAGLGASTLPTDPKKVGYAWEGFRISAGDVVRDSTHRLDLKYWDPDVRQRVLDLEKRRRSGKAQSIRDMNLIETVRGKSPPAAEYVARSEGYALVVKAGSNISKLGRLITDGDYIEESYFLAHRSRFVELQDGDILLASTGDGTLGKCCVYRNKNGRGEDLPAIADSHVTVIRMDPSKVWPEYLCDYLRLGFGADQVNRFYSGSTGLIEITPEDVNRIVMPLLPLPKQKAASEKLRSGEEDAEKEAEEVRLHFHTTRSEFYRGTVPRRSPKRARKAPELV